MRRVARPSARYSMWAARPARSRRRYAVRSMRETEAAASRVVAFASPMPTTSCTGRTAEKPSWTIPCCFVAAITAGSTRVATGSVATGTGRSCSSHRRGRRCSSRDASPRHRRCPSCRRIRYRISCVATANEGSGPTSRAERRGGKGTGIFRGPSRRRPSTRSMPETSGAHTSQPSTSHPSKGSSSTTSPSRSIRRRTVGR